MHSAGLELILLLPDANSYGLGSFSHDFGRRSLVPQKQFQTKTATSIVASVHRGSTELLVRLAQPPGCSNRDVTPSYQDTRSNPRLFKLEHRNTSTTHYPLQKRLLLGDSTIFFRGTIARVA